MSPVSLYTDGDRRMKFAPTRTLMFAFRSFSTSGARSLNVNVSSADRVPSGVTGVNPNRGISDRSRASIG